MAEHQSELAVITKAKDLCSYIMTVTQKSPKQFRFTFVSRLQNLSLDIIENLFQANEVFVIRGDEHAAGLRLSYQRKAMSNLKLITYFALLATEQKCLLMKQYEQISRLAYETENLLGAWMTSDRRRFGKN